VFRFWFRSCVERLLNAIYILGFLKGFLDCLFPEKTSVLYARDRELYIRNSSYLLLHNAMLHVAIRVSCIHHLS
jgi:hypothetical protein